MERIKLFFMNAWAWILEHKKISIAAGVVVAAVVIFLSGYIQGCVK